MEISVIGAGYVGLTTAACLAQLGHRVFCAESDTVKLRQLQHGKLPFFEPHLEEIVLQSSGAARLNFGSTAEAIDRGHAIFICVGTPPLENGEADLSAIESVACMIADRARGYRLVIEKSTVPVRTGYQLHRYLSLHRHDALQYDVVSNPEFLREGSAVENFFHPDRLVVGTETRRAADTMAAIYRPILEGSFSCPVHSECRRPEVPFLITDTNSAELIKHACNSFLAMKISYVNLIADLCEAAGADINKVAEGMGLDPRIGPAFLRPGIGFGGFCFPKDLQAFTRIADRLGCDFSLLKEVERINKGRVDRFIEKIKNELWVVRGKKIAIWGLTFKPNTDDVRFAPSIPIIRRLLSEGACIQAYDPQGMKKARTEFPNLTYCRDIYEAATGAEAIVVLTEWRDFESPEWNRLVNVVQRALLIDGRNMFNADEVSQHGFEYVGIGGLSALPALAEPIITEKPGRLSKHAYSATVPDNI